MNLVKSFIALLIGLLVSFFAAEWVIANFGAVDTPPGLFQKTSTRPFVHRPFFKGKDRYRNPIIINSTGLRDSEYTFKKPENVFRVLVLGDSVAFGDGVRSEDTFEKQMEGLWSLEAKNVEVLNAGVRGYNTASELALFKEVGLRYSPSLVIVAYVLNDAEPTSKQMGLIDKKYSFLMTLKDYAKEHFYLYSLFRRCFEIARHEASPKTFIETYEDQFHPDHPGWKESYASLEAIHRLANENNIRLLLAVFPRLEGLRAGEVYPAQSIQNQVLEAGRELGIDTFDLLPALKGQDEALLKIEARDTFHPNRQGHLLIARALKKVVDERYLNA